MIHVIIGNQRNGKSLLMCNFAYAYYKKHRTIYSNLHFNFPYNPIDYNDIIECKYNNAAVFIDEVHLFLNNRRAMSKINIEVTNSFLSQVAKQDLELYMSTQRFSKIDIKIRNECHYIYKCKKFVHQKGIFVPSNINENYPKETIIIISIERFDMDTEEMISSAFIANDFFDLYDTKQIIKITGLPND